MISFAAGAIPALPYNIALLKGGALVGVDIVETCSAGRGWAGSSSAGSWRLAMNLLGDGLRDVLDPRLKA